MTELLEVNSIARDHHTLGAEPVALFEAGLPFKKDHSLRPEYAMPRNFFARAKRPYDLASRAWMTGSRGHLTVSCDPAFRNTANGFEYPIEHSVRQKAIVDLNLITARQTIGFIRHADDGHEFSEHRICHAGFAGARRM